MKHTSGVISRSRRRVEVTACALLRLHVRSVLELCIVSLRYALTNYIE